MRDILSREGKLLLLGNEAIARGCLEAGAGVVATYPGTPSSEVGGVLEEVADEAGMYFEYSTNEKVAMEVCGAAAASGVRSFAFMKHVGLNVASDAFMTLGYTGVEAGMVVLSADDPSSHSSQNEQDNRYYSKLALVPMLEPSTPAEAKEMMVQAFDISEQLKSPVLLRTTTRVNHARGVVSLDRVPDISTEGEFERDIQKFVTVPAHARIGRKRQLKRQQKAQKLSERSPLNFSVGLGDIGVITSGVSYTYAREWLDNVEILKLGFTNPLPEQKIRKFLSNKRYVVVVEELEPFLEDQVLRIAKQAGLETPVYGKRTGHLPRAFEYSPDTLSDIGDILQIKDRPEPLTSGGEGPEELPSRPPMLCAGCPHRGTYYSANQVLDKEDAIYTTDIGCYTLGIQPPLEVGDFLLCMGSSVGAAGGFSKVSDKKIMAFIGDSTFFHAGIPGLVNAVFNDHRFVLVIMDNRTTAMTGHQPNPGTGRDYGDRITPPMKIEPLVRGCGVEFVDKVDPYDLEGTQRSMEEALAHDGVAVIIAERACPLLLRKQDDLEVVPYGIDQEQCVQCYRCVEDLSCPALIRKGEEVFIDQSMCTGCGLCAQVCPSGAIEVVE